MCYDVEIIWAQVKLWIDRVMEWLRSNTHVPQLLQNRSQNANKLHCRPNILRDICRGKETKVRHSLCLKRLQIAFIPINWSLVSILRQQRPFAGIQDSLTWVTALYVTDIPVSDQLF